MPKNLEAIKDSSNTESGIPDVYYPLPISYGSAKNLRAQWRVIFADATNLQLTNHRKYQS
jgi:hypothetical protein